MGDKTQAGSSNPNTNVNPTATGQPTFPYQNNPYGFPAGNQLGQYSPFGGYGANFNPNLGGQAGAILTGISVVDSKSLEAEQKNMREDISKMSLDDFSEAISADDLDAIFWTSMLLFAFAGFSPSEVFLTLKLYATLAKISLDEFVRDVVDLISYYMKRGTSIQRRGMTNAINEEAQTKINSLLQRYRIQDNVYSTSKGPRIVTLARIMNTFPEVVGQKLSKQLAPPIGQTGLVPLCLSFAGGASLIPSNPSWNPLFEKFLDWAVSFDKIMNRLRRQQQGLVFDEKSSRENQRMWADLARANSRHTDDFRANFIVKWSWDFDLGLIMEDGAIIGYKWDDMEPSDGVNPYSIRDAVEKAAKGKGKAKESGNVNV